MGSGPHQSAAGAPTGRKNNTEPRGNERATTIGEDADGRMAPFRRK